MNHTEYCQTVHGPAQMRGVHDCDICAAYRQGRNDIAEPLQAEVKRVTGVGLDLIHVAAIVEILDTP